MDDGLRAAHGRGRSEVGLSPSIRGRVQARAMTALSDATWSFAIG